MQITVAFRYLAVQGTLENTVIRTSTYMYQICRTEEK